MVPFFVSLYYRDKWTPITDYPHSSKYLLCSTEERHLYMFGTTWRWVNDDEMFIFVWNIILIECDRWGLAPKMSFHVVWRLFQPVLINRIFPLDLFVWFFTFTFMHLADAFIQSDLQCIQAIHLYCQYVCSLGIEPTTFALLTQCSNHWATGTFLYLLWGNILFTSSLLTCIRHVHHLTLHIVNCSQICRATTS